jgi:hypothetical protein
VESPLRGFLQGTFAKRSQVTRHEQHSLANDLHFSGKMATQFPPLGKITIAEILLFRWTLVLFAEPSGMPSWRLHAAKRTLFASCVFPGDTTCPRPLQFPNDTCMSPLTHCNCPTVYTNAHLIVGFPNQAEQCSGCDLTQSCAMSQPFE